EDAEAVLDGAQVVGGHLALTWLRRAAGELEVRTLDGKPVRRVALPGIGDVSGMTGNPEDDAAYFAFNSFVQPPQVFRTSIARGGRDLYAAVDVPIDPAPYTVEQVRY